MESNKNAKIISWLNIGLVVAFFSILLIVGTFKDLDIASQIYNKGNAFGKIFEAIGKLPGYIILGVGFAILFNCAITKKDAKVISKVALGAVYCVGGLVSGALLALDLAEMLLTGAKVYFVAGVIGLGVFSLEFCSLNVKRNVDWTKYRKFAFSAIFAVLAILIVCAGLKIVCGRLRYEQILAGEGAFANWYSFQRAGGSSLPSGHMAMACAGYLLLPLCKKNVSKIVVDVATMAFAIVVLISRMSIGAHFLSDVAIAGIVSFVICMVANRLSFGADNDRLEFGEKNFLAKL
ncbi:MAG: phosphatase PAP2 family protein [Clostridia bacterium]